MRRGPKIITQVLLAIVRVLDFEQSLPEAVEGAAFPSSVAAECRFVRKGPRAEIVEGLANAGTMWKKSTAAAGRRRLRVIVDGKLVGVADPRSQAVKRPGIRLTNGYDHIRRINFFAAQVLQP